MKREARMGESEYRQRVDDAMRSIDVAAVESNPARPPPMLKPTHASFCPLERGEVRRRNLLAWWSAGRYLSKSWS